MHINIVFSWLQQHDKRWMLWPFLWNSYKGISFLRVSSFFISLFFFIKLPLCGSCKHYWFIPALWLPHFLPTSPEISISYIREIMYFYIWSLLAPDASFIHDKVLVKWKSNPDGAANITGNVLPRRRRRSFPSSKQIVTKIWNLKSLAATTHMWLFYALLAIRFHFPMPAVVRCKQQQNPLSDK